MKGLPPETRDQLQAMAQAARSEIAAREQQAAQPAAPAAEQPAAPLPNSQPLKRRREQPAEDRSARPPWNFRLMWPLF